MSNRYAQAHPEKWKAYMRRWRAEHPDYFRNNDLQRKHGITAEEYDAQLVCQGGVRALCRLPERMRQSRRTDIPRALAVDHDHATGLNRELLCGFCNMVVGLVETRLDLVLAAMSYLHGHDAKAVGFGPGIPAESLYELAAFAAPRDREL